MQNVPSSFAPYQPPPPPLALKKERGVFLTLMLILTTLSSVAGTFLIVLGGAAIDQATSASGRLAVDSSTHQHVAKMILALAIFQIVQLASVMGMWAWKKIAVLGYFATTVVVVAASAKIFGSMPTITMIFAGLMLAAVFPRLGSFD
ncbi:MAG TPA: hypothetical protein VF407_23215 [Polyangiaceae bacterium]